MEQPILLIWPSSADPVSSNRMFVHAKLRQMLQLQNTSLHGTLTLCTLPQHTLFQQMQGLHLAAPSSVSGTGNEARLTSHANSINRLHTHCRRDITCPTQMFLRGFAAERLVPLVMLFE
jgi:hypothetical protein